MKKIISIFIFLLLNLIVNAQNISISFQSKVSGNSIDSVQATNLRTNKIVRLTGGESLSLVKFYTGINSITDKSELGYIYPNPSNNNATFSFLNDKNQEVKIGIYNNFGQLLSQSTQNLTQGIHSFEMHFQAAGIYYLSVLKGNMIVSYKAIYTGNNTLSSNIKYLGNQQIITPNYKLELLKSAATFKEIEYSQGDVIIYSFFSGKNTTVMTDKPTTSKTIDVEFVSCLDKDNKGYKAVKIGTQWWMAENLAYLPAVSPPSAGSDVTPYYYVYDYLGTEITAALSTINYKKYGVLYNWPAAKASCPTGWHLPSDSEWKQLELTLGMSQQQVDTIGWRGTDQGKLMKSTIGWNNSGNGTNTAGFSALPAGYRYNNGSFMHIGNEGCWWSSTDYSTNEPWFHFVTYWNGKVNRNHNFNLGRYGWSVRCVKD